MELLQSATKRFFGHTLGRKNSFSTRSANRRRHLRAETLEVRQLLTVSITGTVYNDRNADTTQGADEMPLSFWTIYIDQNQNSLLDPGETTALSTPTGEYTFNDLPAGTYQVRAVIQPGWTQTVPGANGYMVNLPAGGTVTGRDFGFRRLAGAPIAWLSQGPMPANDGQVTGMTAEGSPVSGAIQVLAPSPSNANILYAGTVNGGIWKTTNATSSSPTWTALTDTAGSLSIAAMEIDPFDSSGNTIVAGIGRKSSLDFEGGQLQGLLRTVDGGVTWLPFGTSRLAGLDITGVVARGSTIVVSSRDGHNNIGQAAGLYRAINSQSFFLRISGASGTGLPNGPVTSLVGDPSNLNRLYAAVLGVGIFRSDDTGATWTDVTSNITGIGASTNGLQIAVHGNGVTNAVYVGVMNHGQLTHMYRSTNFGGSWTAMGLPETIEGGVPVGLNSNPQPGPAGGLYFSLVADPNNASLVYVGGDQQPLGTGGVFPNSIGAVNFTGRLFRGDASQPLNLQWTPLTDDFADPDGPGGTDGTAPHNGSRSMVFDVAGTLLEADGGGVYRRTAPQQSTGTWQPMIGTLQATEIHSTAYDSVTHTIVSGTQDNGSMEQPSFAAKVYNVILQGNSGVVQVDDSQDATSIRYESLNNLKDLVRRTFDSSGTLVNQQTPTLILAGSGGQSLPNVDPLLPITPLVINAIDPTRLVIGGKFDVYESSDRGDNVHHLNFAGALGASTIHTFAYGGRSQGVANPNVLYVGTSTGVYLRTTAGGALAHLNSYPGNGALDIALDPNDWRTAWVVDGNDVFRTANAGQTWTKVTGNLSDPTLRSITFFDGTTTDMVFLGGDVNVYGSPAIATGSWAPVALGLPHAPIMDLDYDLRDDVLVAATLGRGSWIIPNLNAAIAANNPPTPGQTLIGVDSVSVVEQSVGPTTMTFTVTLSKAPTQTVMVNYATANGTAKAGIDYQPVSGTLTFARGSVTSKTITVNILPNPAVSGSQTLFMNLSNAVGGTIAAPQGIGTIIRNNTPVAPQSTIGLYNPASGEYFLRNELTPGPADESFVFGPGGTSPAWIPLTGDWNADGKDTPGLFDPATSGFYLRFSNSAGAANQSFVFGPANSGWVPLSGDWDADGQDTIGLYDPSTATFFLRSSNSAGPADTTFVYGPAGLGWIPIVGDWNGDGRDTIGLYNPVNSQFFLRESNSAGPADITFIFGPGGAGWTPLSGDFSASGVDSIGLFNPATSEFFLRYTAGAGPADLSIQYGPPGPSPAWVPLTGDFNGTSSLMLAEPAIAPGASTPRLSNQDLRPLVDEAILRWQSRGITGAQLLTLRNTPVGLAELPGNSVGWTQLDRIWLDYDAAGHGWFVDPTPWNDDEFAPGSPSSATLDRVDALSVIEHELGHILGLDHDDSVGVMSQYLPLGVRRT